MPRSRPRSGLADTSLFIAKDQGREPAGTPPEYIQVSVITIGELRLGVLAAHDGQTRAQRLATLSHAEALSPLPVDDRVAQVWAALRISLRDSGLRMPLNDSWIAATAIAHKLPIVARDSDYDGVPGLTVVRV